MSDGITTRRAPEWAWDIIFRMMDDYECHYVPEKDVEAALVAMSIASGNPEDVELSRAFVDAWIKDSEAENAET
jgi:hypothetical protein